MTYVITKPQWVNTLRPRQNGRRFADDTFRRIFLNENVKISIKISLKFVPKDPINNNPALVQIMAWRLSGDKPLSEPMMVSLLTHICVTQPQWVNIHWTWLLLHLPSNINKQYFIIHQVFHHSKELWLDIQGSYHKTCPFMGHLILENLSYMQHSNTTDNCRVMENKKYTITYQYFHITNPLWGESTWLCWGEYQYLRGHTDIKKCDNNNQHKFLIHSVIINSDIGKTFGPLPDQRTSNHLENPSYTGPPKLLQDLIFLTLESP